MTVSGWRCLSVLQPAEGASRSCPRRAGGREQVLKRITSASVGVVGQLVALPAQAADDQLAVEHVHLAADGFDVQSFWCGRA